MNITWLNSEDAGKVWPLVEPFLVSALKRWLPVYFASDLLGMVQKGELQLWIITENNREKLHGAALTEIRNYPRAKIMNIFMLGGKDMPKWKEDFCDAMEMFSRSQGCDFIQATGRRGWSAFGKSRGAFESAVVTNMVLT